MKQMNDNPKIDSQESRHSDNLMQQMMSRPCDLADLWGRAADSFPENKRKLRICTAIAVAVGVIIGALAMLFLSSPERWIRL